MRFERAARKYAKTDDPFVAEGAALNLVRFNDYLGNRETPEERYSRVYAAAKDIALTLQSKDDQPHGTS